nr:MAG TPA: hypothetical protein [Caudoviricetes sp.]
MYVNLKVSNQTLRRTSFEQIVENSVNYLYLKLEASEDWTGTKKRGYFSQNGTMWYISDFNDDNECEVPIEVVKASGFKLYLVARDTNNEVKITTNIIDLNVSKTGNEQGEKPSLTEINSDTLEVSREGNIIRLEIPITYTTDEELQQAILESGNNFNSKLQETKTDLEKKLSNVQEEFNADVSTLNDTISSNKTALIERMDNLSAEQEKALENEINNVKTGATIVNRAINDEGGNDIQRTYPTKIITELNPTNYKLSITLLNKYNKTVSTQEVDFPAESSVVNARLDKSTNTLYLVLRNGNETAVPLSAIIRNLATEDYVVSKIEIISQRIDEEVKTLNAKIANTLVKPETSTIATRVAAIEGGTTNQTFISSTHTNQASTVMMRDGKGCCQVDAPSSSYVNDSLYAKNIVNFGTLKDYAFARPEKGSYYENAKAIPYSQNGKLYFLVASDSAGIDSSPPDIAMRTMGGLLKANSVEVQNADVNSQFVVNCRLLKEYVAMKTGTPQYLHIVKFKQSQTAGTPHATMTVINDSPDTLTMEQIAVIGNEQTYISFTFMASNYNLKHKIGLTVLSIRYIEQTSSIISVTTEMLTYEQSSGSTGYTPTIDAVTIFYLTSGITQEVYKLYTP